MSAAVISVINRKGGVGKTSTAVHLGGCLAERGKRVLLIDNDPQHSLTSGLLGLREATLIPSEQTIAALFDDTCRPELDELIHDTEIDGLSIVAGSDSLSFYNLPEPDKAGPIQLVLREFIDQIRDDYDVILIDNPPNLQLCSIASLAASDLALCVSQAEDFGSQGAVAVQEAINTVRGSLNSKLQFLGFVLNMFDRRLSLHLAYEETLRETYGELVFATRLPQAVIFKEAITARVPVTVFKSRTIAADAVRDLADELLERLQGAATTQRKKRAAS